MNTTINLIKKPHKIFFTSAILTLLITLITYAFIGNSTTDIHAFGTYFIIEYTRILFILALAYALLGYIYWKFRAIPLYFLLTGLHVLLSFTALFATLYLIYHFLWIDNIPRRYYSFATYDFVGFNPFDGFIQMGFIFCVAQLFLIFNLIISYRKHLSKSEQ